MALFEGGGRGDAVGLPPSHGSGPAGGRWSPSDYGVAADLVGPGGRSGGRPVACRRVRAALAPGRSSSDPQTSEEESSSEREASPVKVILVTESIGRSPGGGSSTTLRLGGRSSPLVAAGWPARPCSRAMMRHASWRAMLAPLRGAALGILFHCFPLRAQAQSCA